jgi:malonate transporter
MIIELLIPVFGIVLLGWIARRLGVLGASGAKTLNAFVYFFALPPLLFRLTARASLDEILRWLFIAAYAASTLLTLLLALAGGRLLFGLRFPELGVHGLAACFGNTAYMGIPLFLAAWGPRGALPAIVATVAGNTLFMGGAIAAIEWAGAARGDAGQTTAPRKAAAALKAAAAVVRNPLLAASLLGLLVSGLGISLPAAAWDLLEVLGGAAVPGALFALGLSLSARPETARLSTRGPPGRGWGQVGWLVALKLLVHPLLAWALVTWAVSLDPLWRDAAILLAAMPAGSLVYVVAEGYDCYVERASAAVLLSTILSVPTLLMLMGRMGVGR